ncbi:MAG TPA: UDP-N-acetylmuramoyl-tripeptide--D-alanyl-D-alanine ligase [Bryobacteraceae bacterium]
MDLFLAQVQQATQAQFVPATPATDLRVRGWSIDSRTVGEGDLFFAIKGDRFDGHAFTAAALERGAVAAVVSEAVTPAATHGLLLQVGDTLRALQALAHWARRNWGRPIVAVTGSAGKTGTKDIIAELLSVRLRIGKTVGNLNNHIGLPLTLLRIPDDAEVAVVELGMNHAGEIRHLASIAEPQYGVVTNVGYAHVESFDSIEGVAAAKRELIESLPASGIAVLNADDPLVLKFREVHPDRALSYGFSAKADIQATEVEIHPNGAAFTVRGVRFHSHLSGRYGVSNVLAGLAVAHLFHIEFSELADTVARLSPGKMRGERHHWRDITVLNDSYNSNPEAARNMIDVLCAEAAKRRIAVLGEMLELGHMSGKLHRDLGAYAARAGVDVLIGIRGAARLMVEEAQNAGLSEAAAFFFEDSEAAGFFLRDFARPGDAILFKGSRGTYVERALDRMEA